EISDLERELDDIDRKKIDSFVVAHKKLQETRNSIVKDLNAQSGTVSELVGSKQILLLKQKELHKKIENLDNVSEEEYLESKDILEKNAEAKAKQEIHSKLIKELSKQL